MTPKELYDWAVETGAEDYDIKIHVFINGWGDLTYDIDDDGIVTRKRSETITIEL